MKRFLQTYELSVNDCEQNVYDTARIQLSIGPEEEDFSRTLCTVLSYAHCLAFQPALGDGLYDVKQPMISAKDTQGEYELWGYVGEVQKKALKTIQKLEHIPHVRFYFFRPSQKDHFCQLLKGSKQNWVRNYRFFLFDERFLEGLHHQQENRRNQWDLSFVEGALYLTIGDETLESQVEEIDIWKTYQTHLSSKEDR
ncbi:YaeQ family protein [bacterium]|nr:YaeQ family protein [bacterium]